MFIFNLNYIKPIDELQKVLPRHFQYLDQHYQTREFICSGRKVPRTGGVILCNCSTREEADALMVQDPFYIEGIAQYELIEFEPAKALEDFRAIISGEN